MSASVVLPDWHRLMHEWIRRGKGNTGLTLPFLAGALALARGQQIVRAQELRALIDTMVAYPVPGYFVGVRRCGNIKTLVLSVLTLNDQLIRKCEARSSNGQLSFAFSPDATGPFGGLDCNCTVNCIEKLISYCAPHTEAGKFSRVFDPSLSDFVYAPFHDEDIRFIEEVLGGEKN